MLIFLGPIYLAYFSEGAVECRYNVLLGNDCNKIITALTNAALQERLIVMKRKRKCNFTCNDNGIELF